MSIEASSDVNGASSTKKHDSKIRETLGIKIMSINVCGLGAEYKHNWLRDSFKSQNLDLVVALDRIILDHNLLLLSVGPSDFGPKPFKIFDTWMGLNDFYSALASSWGTGSYKGVCDIVLKNKIKKLRADIKDWSHKKHVDQSRNKKEICDRIKDWDEKAENGL
uniref:RNA-directed DNA polymerase, eukaryota n=1 Tax=Tanacetum cinerariifolium TaxID=118510 RepID=A0A6L2K4V8_TANCI|nr:RNA-directed DNA polymerase, eukaryota [Tanacetum cinerariifolium]